MPNDTSFEEAIWLWEKQNSIELKKGEWKTKVEEITVSYLYNELLECKNLRIIRLPEHTDLNHINDAFLSKLPNCEIHLLYPDLSKCSSVLQSKVTKIILDIPPQYQYSIDSCFKLLHKFKQLKTLTLQVNIDTIRLPLHLLSTNLKVLNIEGFIFVENYQLYLNSDTILPFLEEIFVSSVNTLTADFALFPNLKILSIFSRNYDIQNLPSLYNLKELNIKSRGKRPNQIFEIPNLEKLNISSYLISDSIKFLTSLKSFRLNAYSDWDFTIPEGIGSLVNLKNFSISGLGEKRLILPKSIENLSELEVIDIQNANCQDLSINFSKFQHLKELVLISTHLACLDNSIWSLSELEALNISDNKITYLSDSIQYLQKLRILRLKDNALDKIPNGITKLKQLEDLTISRSVNQKFPKDFGQLSSLIVLGLWGFDSLPDVIYSLTNLKMLLLYDIKYIGKDISKLTNLRQLRIHSWYIRDLPRGIGHLKQLRYLSLLVSKKPTLPKNIGNCRNLRALFIGIDFADINILKMPRSVKKLKRLVFLGQINCKIKFPPEFVKMKHLKYVYGYHTEEGYKSYKIENKANIILNRCRVKDSFDFVDYMDKYFLKNWFYDR